MSTLYGPKWVVLAVKNLLTNARDVRDMSLIPGLGRSPGGEHGNSLQYSCLENPIGYHPMKISEHDHSVKNQS